MSYPVFALWATACEQAFWEAGTFANAYGQNRDDAVQTVIEADHVATPVQKLMAERTEWQGTSMDLLGALKMAVEEEQTNKLEKLKEWPATPRALSGRMRRAAATLRRVGISVKFDKSDDRKRSRLITIARIDGGGDRPDRPYSPDSQDINDLGADGRPNRPSAHNLLKNKAADGADANFPAYSDGGAEPRFAASTTASVPFMLTQAMKRQLRARPFRRQNR